MDVKVHATPDDVANAVASIVADSILAADGGAFTLGLAGGSTPEATYRELSNAEVPWDSVTAWMTDERWVDHSDDRNNGRMAVETLLGHTSATLLRPSYAPEASPEWSALNYEGRLEETFGSARPDIALLGLGSDGHTASLFPESDALDEKERLYVANTIPSTGERRLTATYPLLGRVRRLVVIVVGHGKATALRDSFDGRTPAGRLAEGDGEVVWHVDEAAAELL